MTRKQKLASSGIGIVISCLICVVVVTQVIFPERDSKTIAAQQSSTKDPNAGKVTVGGVIRPVSDISNLKRESRQAANKLQKPQNDKNGPDGYGLIPAVDPKENETVADAAQKINEKGVRAGSMLRSKKFDAKSFADNPKKYASEFEPFRVFDPAQPAEGVPVLVRASKKRNTMVQGESLSLSVKAKKSTPVTFTSFDGGTFGNNLSSMCVLADEKGIAQVEFLATPGVIANSKVLASSPLTSGVVDFQIGVTQTAPAVPAVR